MEPNSPEKQGRYMHLDCGNWPYGCPQCLDHNMRSEGSMEVNNVWKDSYGTFPPLPPPSLPSEGLLELENSFKLYGLDYLDIPLLGDDSPCPSMTVTTTTTTAAAAAAAVTTQSAESERIAARELPPIPSTLPSTSQILDGTPAPILPKRNTPPPSPKTKTRKRSWCADINEEYPRNVDMNGYRTRSQTRSMRMSSRPPVASSSNRRLEDIPVAHVSVTKRPGESNKPTRILRSKPSVINVPPSTKRRRLASGCNTAPSRATPSSRSPQSQDKNVATSKKRYKESLYRLFRIYRGSENPKCGIDGCTVILRWNTKRELSAARKHLENAHYGVPVRLPGKKAGPKCAPPKGGWRCCMQGCKNTKRYTTVRGLTRHHEEKHCGWGARCPGCGGKFNRFDRVKNHYVHTKLENHECWEDAVCAVEASGEAFQWPEGDLEGGSEDESDEETDDSEDEDD